ncbi:MAG: NAD+ synthase [Thermacetogeniaceae bacterium]
MRLAIAQLNTTVGDFKGNAAKICSHIRQAAESGADLVCFPELTITGYPPEDLLLKPSFIEANLRSLESLAAFTKELHIAAVVGFVDLKDGETYDAAAVIYRGALVAVYHKVYLPNYGVFDEKRYFKSGAGGLVIGCAGVNVGVTICEDIWHPVGPAGLEARAGGAQVILNLSASPYHKGKQQFREKMLSVRASDNVTHIAYANLVGGQDELVFDGNSTVFDEEGTLLGRAAAFQEDLLVVDLQTEHMLRTRLHDIRRRERSFPELPGPVCRVDLSAPASGHPPDRVYPPLPLQQPQSQPVAGNAPCGCPLAGTDMAPPGCPLGAGAEAEVYAAVVLGVHDYVNKNGFKRAFIGLSGGIDSSLTAAIAVDALGADRVTGVLLPSPYTSRDSIEDAEELAANLGITALTVPIAPLYETYLDAISPACDSKPGDLTVQNIQARIRGNILMALTNQYGGLVLTTGNKSELSVGYATLYGDMAGGFAVLKDIPKTLVYRLCHYFNRRAGQMVIPQRVFDKAPTAELRPDQRDEDDLPPYAILDQIIEAYVEDDRSPQEIVDRGFDPGVVARVIRMIDRNEYKRRQAPPGVKITHRAFGKDRRMPITNRFDAG